MQPQSASPRSPAAGSRLRRGISLASLTLAVTLATHAALASAQTPPPPPPPMQQGGPGFGGPAGKPSGPRREADRLFARIGATAQQRDQIRTIRRESWDKARPTLDQMRQLREQQLRLLAQPQIDRGALESLRVKQMNLADQMSRQRTETEYRIAEVLSPEQRARFYTMIERRFQRMHDRSEWHRGPGPR